MVSGVSLIVVNYKQARTQIPDSEISAASEVILKLNMSLFQNVLRE